MTYEEVSKFAICRPEKEFKDLDQAVSQGRLEGIGKFEREIGCISIKLYEIIKIDPRAFDKAYGNPSIF